jgi:Flp pilus assembly pilin Flp
MSIGVIKESRSLRLSGQSTAEYALLLAIMAAALLAMQVYIKRGLQGRIRNLSDQLSLVPYEPGQTSSAYTTEQIGLLKQRYENGVSKTEIPETWEDSAGKEHKGEETTRWGYENVAPEQAP